MLRRTFLSIPLAAAAAPRRTTVEIRGDEFWINGKPTYAGRRFGGKKIQGLLMNSRMIQGIFDDENPETIVRWKYPDTGKWDPERNTREFLDAMPVWRQHGLLCFVIGLQGGSPEGYSKSQPWLNSAFRPDGTMKPAYLSRLERILDKADELGMVAMVNYFYFGQDERLEGERAVSRAAENATSWILEKGYRNVVVDVVNESDNRAYQQQILQAPRVHELIGLVKSITGGGRRLLVSTSYNGGSIPKPNVVRESDFVLMHGNGVKDPLRIAEMVRLARQVEGYTPKPVVFNEDDHFDFDKPVNNMLQAVSEYASWGYFDPGRNDYSDGYQSVPVNWGLNNERKRAFFSLLRQVTSP
jgi:hypothetical protein